MPLAESNETQKEPASKDCSQRANDYIATAIECVPASVTLEALNEQNKKYWKNAGGEQA
jgi:hypothetical protein